jgi:hypothetical protein
MCPRVKSMAIVWAWDVVHLGWVSCGVHEIGVMPLIVLSLIEGQMVDLGD